MTSSDPPLLRLHEERQPLLGPCAVASDQPTHTLNLAGSTGNHPQLGVKALQVELTDDAVVSLLDQEPARAGFQPMPDQPKFALSQTKASGVFLITGIGVREQHLGRRLLDDGAADRTVEYVAGALGCQTHDTVELAPGFWAVLGKALKGRIGEQAPEFIHAAHQPPAIEQLPD